MFVHSLESKFFRSVTVGAILAAAVLCLPGIANAAADPSPALRQEALTYTTRAAVDVTANLDLNKGGSCSDIRLANEDGNWGGWIKGAAGSCSVAAHPLSRGFGVKGVFIQARNATGVSNVVFNKYRRVEKISITSLGLPATTTSRHLELRPTFSINDPSIDCGGIKVVDTKTGNIATAPENACHGNLTLDLSDGFGVKTIQAQIHTAGGTTEVYTTTINYTSDGVPNPPHTDPVSGGAIVLDSIDVPATTTSHEVSIKFAYHGGEGCKEYRVAGEDGNWPVGWTTCRSVLQHAASAGLGIKGVFVQIRGSNETVSQIKFAKYRIVSGGADTGGPAPAPVKDTQAPTISKVTVSAGTSNAAATIGIDANDNVGVQMVRFANENGVWGSWIAYGPKMTHSISAGKGYKGLFTQVRDAAGNQSTISFTKFTVN